MAFSENDPAAGTNWLDVGNGLLDLYVEKEKFDMQIELQKMQLAQQQNLLALEREQGLMNQPLPPSGTVQKTGVPSTVGGLLDQLPLEAVALGVALLVVNAIK